MFLPILNRFQKLHNYNSYEWGIDTSNNQTERVTKTMEAIHFGCPENICNTFSGKCKILQIRKFKKYQF